MHQPQVQPMNLWAVNFISSKFFLGVTLSLSKYCLRILILYVGSALQIAFEKLASQILDFFKLHFIFLHRLSFQ